ncbi:MAG: M48 family metallopeptidase [Desulfobacterales bacterium]|nr:M48 family metallopeptidase [Desulfobacterales bacterium]
MQQIMLGDICIDVVHKDIKNVHLSVYPPTGRVRISAPHRMNLETVRIFAISKLGWIRKHQGKFLEQEREAPREYINRESHYYLGERFLFKVIEHNASPKVAIKHETLEMYIRPNTGLEKRKEILDGWYRQRLKEIVPGFIAQYEKMMQIEVAEFAIKKMKTRWGSCNIKAKRIWLNLELAKKPKECIEYIVVHEMTHLLERHHNEKFTAYVDKFLPKWRFYKKELNRRLLRHENWSY